MSWFPPTTSLKSTTRTSWANTQVLRPCSEAKLVALSGRIHFAGIPDTVLPNSPFTNGGQLQARGLLDFSSTAPQPSFVAITGGTADYRTATREVKFIDDIHWELTVITPP
jgi:hypothetical protein